MIVLHFSMQGEDISSTLMASVICLYSLVCKGKIFFSMLMARVICVHFSQLVDIVEHRHPPHNIIEHTYAKILVSALECQVS